jgi:membrane protein
VNFQASWKLVKDTFNDWLEDKASQLGAALAYYSVFAIAPLLIIVLAVASLIFGQEAAQGRIVKEIEGTVGPPVAHAIQEILKNNQQTGSATLATVIGLITLVFGATGVFGQLQDALNTIWKVAPKPGRGLWGIIQDRFLSLSMVFGTGFLLLVSLVITAALSALNGLWTPESLPEGVGAFLWHALNALISFGLITLLFAALFKFLPDVEIAWRDVWIGAALTSLLFTLGKYLLGVYLGRASVTSAYGAAGSLVIILLWVYYSSQILLFGAEFTRVYANQYGSGSKVAGNAVPVTHQKLAQQGRPRDKDVALAAQGQHHS